MIVELRTKRFGGKWYGRKYEVPPGYVLVEFVGDQSPFDDPFVAMRIQLGHYSRDQIEVMRAMARRAVKPWKNLKRYVAKSHVPGLSRDYTWGTGDPKKPLMDPGEPGSFIQMMTNRDADLLRSSDSGYQFVIHPIEDQIIVPPTDIRIVERDDFGQGKQLRFGAFQNR